MSTTFPAIEIFRRGTQVAADGRAHAFSDAELAAAAAGYDPALHQAPLVVGHPTHDAPAYGWVGALAYDDGAGLLLGTPQQVAGELIEAHRAGRLKYHSASFYRPSAPTNPKPGIFYLRHLGFLGAMPPAVKGLRPAEFSEADLADTLTLTFAESDPMPDPVDRTAEFAEREANIAAREGALQEQAARLAEQAARLAERAAADHRAECAAFCERLVTDGRLLPRDRDAAAALLASLPMDDSAAHADFAGPAETRGDGPAARTPAAYLRDLLARLPVQVDFSERTPPEGEGAVADFRAPDGYAMDAAGLALLRKAKQYQAAHPDTDFQAAVAAVTHGA